MVVAAVAAASLLSSSSASFVLCKHVYPNVRVSRTRRIRASRANISQEGASFCLRLAYRNFRDVALYGENLTKVQRSILEEEVAPTSLSFSSNPVLSRRPGVLNDLSFVMFCDVSLSSLLLLSLPCCDTQAVRWLGLATDHHFFNDGGGMAVELNLHPVHLQGWFDEEERQDYLVSVPGERVEAYAIDSRFGRAQVGV